MINTLITQNVQNNQSNSLVAMGSNVRSSFGDPRETLISACVKLQESNLVIRAQSTIMRTPAFPPGNGEDYANATLLVSHQGSPEDLLEVLHEVENAMGRERKTRWGSRVLDLDLLAVGDEIRPSREILSRWMGLDLAAQLREMPDELILPHPRLQDRAFVLVPLAEIAPDWTHPILGLTVTQMLDALDPRDIESAVPYE